MEATDNAITEIDTPQLQQMILEQEINELFDSGFSKHSWRSRARKPVPAVQQSYNGSTSAQTGQSGTESEAVMTALSPARLQQPAASLHLQINSSACVGSRAIMPDGLLALTHPVQYAFSHWDYESSNMALQGDSERAIDDLGYNFVMPDEYQGNLFVFKLRMDPEVCNHYWPAHMGGRWMDRDKVRYYIDRMNRRIAIITLVHERVTMGAAKGAKLDQMTGEALVREAQEKLGDISGSGDLTPYEPGVPSSGEDLALWPSNWWEIRKLVVEPHHLLCEQLVKRYGQHHERYHAIRGAIDALCFMRSLAKGSVPELGYREFLTRVANVPFDQRDRTVADVKWLVDTSNVIRLLQLAP